MLSIRKVNTASRAIAIQIVRYENRKVVVKHIGSGHNKDEVSALVASAQKWIEQKTKQRPLFQKKQQRVLSLATTQYIGVAHTLIRDVLLQIAGICGFNTTNDMFLLDFAIMLRSPIGEDVKSLLKRLGVSY